MNPDRLESLVEHHVQRRDATLDIEPDGPVGTQSDVRAAVNPLEEAIRDWLKAADEYYDDEEKARLWAYALKPWMDTLVSLDAVLSHANEAQQLELVRRLCVYWTEGF